MKGSAVRIRASAPSKGPLSGPFFASAGGRAPAAGRRRPFAVSVAVCMEERFRCERRVEVGGRRALLDGGRAVGAGLPQPLEGALAATTGLLELRRADRADEVRVLDVAAA